MMKASRETCYDAECDWYLLTTCNFRCRYCFIPTEALGAKLQVHASPAAWADAFDKTGKRWLIHMTGGEPTIYPDFVELCSRLTNRHLISFNSNLSRSAIRRLAECVDPASVNFINGGLHSRERMRHGELDDFVANARILRDAGFLLVVTAVATPELISGLPALHERLVRDGLWIAPKVLRGVHAGLTYPRDYTDPQREKLRAAIARARDHYGPVFAAAPGGRPSIDVFSDDDLLDDVPDFRGRLCSAGLSFVRIEPNGDVHRCSPDRPMGNLLDGSIRFASGPTACDTHHCVYFCRKYTADAARRSPSLAMLYNAARLKTATVRNMRVWAQRAAVLLDR